MKKIISLVVLGIVVIVVGAIIYISMNASSMVKAGVETYAPQYTKTKVELGGVDASLFAGEISINDFFIGNPKGFKTSHAFKVKLVKIVVDVRSLTGNTIHVREIIIDAPDIIYELGGNAGSNLQTIQNNVTKSAGGGKAKAAKSDSGDGPKIIIDNLYIRNAKVALSAGILGGKKLPVPVPDIHLKDIGKDSNGGEGATMSEAAGKVMDALTGSVTKAASSIDIKGIASQAEGLVKGATGDAGKGITDGLKSLFGK